MKLLVELGRLAEQLRRQGLRLSLLAGWDKLNRWVTGGPLGRFSKISETIWLGGQPHERGRERLIEAGVTGFVNMRSEYDYEHLFEFPEGRYLHLPTDDNTAPTLEHLAAGVDFIREEVENGGQVYIHCWEGLGRGPTMVAAYFVSLGLTPQEAWERIRDVRPFVRPTQTQLDRLRLFAETYHPGEVLEHIKAQEAVSPPPDPQQARKV